MIERLEKELLQARKDKDRTKASLISVVIGDIQTESKKGKSNTPETSEKLAEAIINKMIKGLYSVLNLEGITEEARAQAVWEKSYLETYLPKKLTEDEIRTIMIREMFGNLGQCMKYFRENFGQAVENNTVRAIFEESGK